MTTLEGEPILWVAIRPPDETGYYSQEGLVRITTKMPEAFSNPETVQKFAQALTVLATFARVNVELYHENATEKDIPLPLLEAADLAVVFDEHCNVLFRKARDES